jgi:hypothetical protein
LRRLALAAVVWLSAPQAFEAQTPAPGERLTVVLLLDVSASVSHLPLALDPRFAQVFNAFLQGLAPADRAAVGVIARETRFSQVTSDRRELATSVRQLLQVADTVRLGPSPVWDALIEAVPVAVDPSGRSAIVLFSDGKSAGNVHGLDEVIDRARQSRVSVSAVVEGPSTVLLARATSALDPGDAIERLTQATGGHRLLDRPPDPRQRNPGPLVSLIMEQLHR